jgi:ankyrin repeat protein
VGGDDRLEIIKCLITAKADFTAGNDRAIKVASARGHLNVVKLLAAAKADVAVEDNYPIRIAHEHKHDDVVTYLISMGANPATIGLGTIGRGDIDEVDNYPQRLIELLRNNTLFR